MNAHDTQGTLDELDPLPYTLPQPLRDRLLSPALIVYLDMVRANISRVVDVLGGDPDRWRPHVKTAKLAPVFIELARAGVRAFKCATTREAACLLETLDATGDSPIDVLLAHPLVGPNLARLGRIAAAYPGSSVSVLCEDPQAVESIPTDLGVFVDVNPGMNRTGIPVDRIDAIAAVATRAGARWRGVHYYDGHLCGLDPETRRRRARAGYDELLVVLAELAGCGVTLPEVVTSGTPTFGVAIDYEPLSRRGEWLHRVSPGTVVLSDMRSAQEIPQVGLVPAALVLTRVVSRPDDGIVTCDAGSKSIAADAGDPCAAVLGAAGLEALTPSEEHLPFRVVHGAAPSRGTELLLIPRHVCPTVNLAERAVIIENGRLREVVDVIGRAHDLLAEDRLEQLSTVECQAC